MDTTTEPHNGARLRAHRVWLSRLAAMMLSVALIATACGGSDDTSDSGASAGSTTNTTDTSSNDDSGSSDTGSGSDADTGSGSDTTDAAPAEPTPVPTRLTSETEGDQAAQVADVELEVQTGGELIYGIATDGTGFNTTDALNEGAFRILTALNDPLVSVNLDGDWVPFVAEDLTPNADFTEWIITLRPDIRFHDGEPLDADAVVANMQAFKAGPNVGFAMAPITSIEATGPLEVTVQMNSSWAAFPYLLFGQPGYMVSPSTIGQNDTFVGVGAFVLESWSPGDLARTVRNDDYWRNAEGYPYLDAITFKVIPEQTARRAALEAGDVDAINGPGDDNILEFLDDPDIDVYIGEAAANEALVLLNTAAAPVDDLRIRRAMAHAIDRQLIIDTFRSGLTIPANSFFEPTSPWYVETDYPQFDPDTAIALVEEYEAEVGPAELTILGRNVASTLENAELIKGMLDAVGIDTTIEPIAPGTEVLPVIGDQFQAIMWAQFSSLDPDGSYVFFHSSGGLLNWSNLVSEKIDTGFDIGRQSDDPAERLEGYTMVQEAFAEEVPMIWLDHLGGVEAAAARPHVHGIPTVTLRDGSEGHGMVAGSYFSWEDVWVEQN